MNKFFLFLIALVIAISPLGFVWIGIASDGVSKGYIFQDKYEKIRIPYNLHVEMHENTLSRFALIKDVRDKKILYYKNDYRTPHSDLFSNKDFLSSDYKLVGEIDTLDESGKKKIMVLASRAYSRDFKVVMTRYAEFQFNPDSVDEQMCRKIIFSVKNVSANK